MMVPTDRETTTEAVTEGMTEMEEIRGGTEMIEGTSTTIAEVTVRLRGLDQGRPLQKTDTATEKEGDRGNVQWRTGIGRRGGV